MRIHPSVLTLLVFTTLVCQACRSRESGSNLRGPYLGQRVPGTVAAMFAPGIVSTRFHEHSHLAISPDGNMLVWTVGFAPGQRTFSPKWATVMMQRDDSSWTDPNLPSFLLAGKDFEFSFAPDGKAAYFTSLRSPAGEDKNDGDIWFVTKDGGTWSDPRPLGAAINTEQWEQQPSVTRGGTLYYVGFWSEGANNYGLYRSVPLGGRHTAPVLLPPSLNSQYVDWTPFIAADESYILFSSTRPGGFGSGDIYISYRESDGVWSEPRNLGTAVNTDANERYPYVSPDGKFLFFVSDRAQPLPFAPPSVSYSDLIEAASGPGNGYSDIYWIDAKVVGIEDTRTGIQ